MYQGVKGTMDLCKAALFQFDRSLKYKVMGLNLELRFGVSSFGFSVAV